MGQLKARTRWTTNDVPKPDYKAWSARARARLHSSIIHSKRDSSRYRKTNAERGRGYRVRKRNARVDGDLNSTLPLPPLDCTYVVRIRALGVPRIIWLMARAMRMRGKESEADPWMFVYASIHLETENDRNAAPPVYTVLHTRLGIVLR